MKASKSISGLLVLILILLSSCKKNGEPSLDFLHPNLYTSSSKIYSLGIERESGVDCDIFKIENKDTIVLYHMNTDKTLDVQEWIIKLDTNISIGQFESIFYDRNSYFIAGDFEDFFNGKKRNIPFIVVNFNNLFFRGRIANYGDHFLLTVSFAYPNEYVSKAVRDDGSVPEPAK